MPLDGFRSEGYLTDMRIKVTQGEFHRTHDAAQEAKERFEQERALTEDELLDVLAKLEAGQCLSDAETGSDLGFATNYIDEIKAVNAALTAK